MKKILLILIATTLILFYEKVDALTLDGNISGQHQAWNSDANLDLSSEYEQQTINMTYSFTNSGNHSYLVIPYSGIQYLQYDTEPDQTINFNYTSWLPYLHIYLVSSNNMWSPCEMQNNMFVCPIVPNATYTQLMFTVDNHGVWGTADYSIELTLKNYFFLYTKDNQSIINNQNSNTQSIINSQNQNTQDIMNQNATYQDTPSEDMTNETQKLEEYERVEKALMSSLDLNMSLMDGITINPNASGFIWNLVDRLRGINPAIVLLVTSVLGMGLIKMVLNR